jgi:hypothetical protein
MIGTIPLIRISRAAHGESVAQARERRPELVTFDTSDLLRIVTRCQTTLSPPEIEAVREAAALIPERSSADIVLTPGGRFRVELARP